MSCKSGGSWTRPSGDVSNDAQGVADCAIKCAGYNYFGLECPRSTGVHCQCANTLSGSSSVAVTNCQRNTGPSNSHCNGPYQHGNYMMGGHGYGSVYKVPLLWNFPASGTGLVKGPKGRCLDAANAGGVDGGVPHMWDCDASNANQQWSYLPLTGQIQHNPPNGKCLTRTSATDNVDMLFYACDEDDETQRWAMDAECVSETGRHPDDPACMSVCPPEDHDTWKHCKTCVNHKTATTRSSQMGSCTSCDEGFVMAPHHNQRFSTKEYCF